ncbi:SDR family NAD(P)-dependent oxidoreductase [Cognatiyoonia sp. IB215446]|uniref:type I polyketide synthase n=1 Tax=Cognatiyoonia sp. IB215446 TaxID=3097355 RepID=UPI002A173757|nr:SDR family NAD(P)-dependent oxidoreductase [Cognatiyoonia sp. IB215446]MDX8349852.1 SDR family NAD(P)-dependent oxidoreductase [Cognatiyoonia sp. IB215446]
MSIDVSSFDAAETDIAIVGMAAHLPGSDTVQAYWDNLKNGIESIRHYSADELLAAGEAAHRLNRPDYVPAAAPLAGYQNFDTEFFGLSAKEAAIMDPQHRRFLEVSWEALENAGHMPENADGPIGVFAGCGMGSYFYFNICSNPKLVDNVGMFLLRHTGNDKDFLSTRLSHILDLKGPSVNVQTACSTSLVATHYATQALLSGECDTALAGGVTIELPQDRGYIYKEGEVLSPDGHCHAFDHRAQGTVFGSGAGVVVLRRLKDAIADGDHIWAVIKGSAINNDGAAKAGYLAPSVDGQAEAIAEAHMIAETPADTIDYIECHGTGTYLGDPIEVAAITQAFNETTDEVGFCRIGSVKTNIGHLDTAAGVASLIKTSLALHHKQIPASLGYEKPNPAIDFETSPFRVNDTLTDWVSHKGPRRAGVNSLGVGGTNAHVVLQEAPELPASEDSDWPFQILTVSGRNKAALDANCAALAQHLRENPDQNLADVAWTLHKGRRGFERRRVIVAETHEDAAAQLEKNDPRRAFTHNVVGEDPDYVFMFPGGGAQYAGMARDLYETEPVFAEWMDKGLEILQPKLDYDIRTLWLPEPGEEAEADAKLTQPSVQLPLIMIVEYALAQLWMSWGVQPSALTGHSMGENTAACVAGVMSFEDCIGLVHLRGKLFDTVPAGGMLSVALPADQLKPLLGEDLDLGAVNAPSLSVATGPQAALDMLETQLKAKEIDCQRIQIDIAAHSRMLEPILQEFGDYLRSIELHAPQIPFTSNRTGKLITDDQAQDPDYWVDHLRGTVHFADCLTTLAEKPERVFIEVGPGRAMSSLAGQHGTVTANQVVSSLRHPKDDIADDAFFMAMLGRIWATGGTFDWGQIWGDARRVKVPLPTYAFQHAAYFIEPGTVTADETNDWLTRSDAPDGWGYRPAWLPRYAACDVDVTGDLSEAEKQIWLIFVDDVGLTAKAAQRLRDAGHDVVTVRPGDTFARDGEGGYFIAPERGRESYDLLISDLNTRDLIPTRILHGWMITGDESFRPGSSFFHRVQEQGFYSMFFLAQAIGGEDLGDDIHICALSTGAMQHKDEALAHPEKATLAGPARVIPREYPNLSVSTLDLSLPERIGRKKRFAQGDLGKLVDNILEEALADPGNGTALIRGGKRFELTYKPAALTDLPDDGQLPVLKQDGVYMITGGFGGIGLTLAEALIKQCNARIALIARSPLPPREAWDTTLKNTAPNAPLARRIKAIQSLEALGGQVLPIAADVSNVEDIRDARAQVEATFGPVNGVIHAAGHIDDAPIMAKDVTSIEDVFAPKIHGTQVLEEVFPDGDLDWLVLFSSSSTATAPIGQVDYVAANEYLNAYAKSRSGDKTTVRAINWGIWADVGMAADAMQMRMGEAELAPFTDTSAPMLDRATFDRAGHRTFTATYGVTDRWFLDEHRTKAGDALVPGTGYLEMAAEALNDMGETAAFEIRDLYFLRPLAVPDDAQVDVRVTLPRSDAGYEFTVESGTDGVFTQNAQASLQILPLAAPEPLDIHAIAKRCSAPIEAGELGWIASPQEAHLKFGPRWRVLQSTAFGQGAGLATLKLPEIAAHDPDAGYILHPGMMDLATGWAMKLIAGYQAQNLWVPVSYRSVKVYAPLPAQVVSWVRNAGDNNADAEIASFDITLAAPDGTVCVDIKGFSIRQMTDVVDFAAQEATATRDEDETARPLSPAEERLRHNLSQGIRAEEGADLFLRALISPHQQIILSSLDLDGLIAQAGQQDDDDAEDGQKFSRPQLDSDFVEPDGPIEERLAGFWQDLLGVDQIGAEDSFFDLGGHSLIAVRLFAQIRKAFQVDFPISVLFEAPTIRKIAALIAERGGAADSEGPSAMSATPKVPTRRFTHLVPMHQGDGGRKPPFFLVAGMFGNVLNLRHLAHLIGSDRPFYGLQARGLLGDEEPHRRIEAAAKDYIAEMRQVQPHGPYHLGGFSGGGITAYEIAHQLRAEGEEVAALVMLDTPLPVRPDIERGDKFRIKLQDIAAKGPKYAVEWAQSRIAWEIEKRRGREETADQGQQFHNLAIQDAFLESVGAYQVKPWDGTLALFRPPLVAKWTVGDRLISHERVYLYPDNDWTKFVPNIEVFEVPGDHDSMVLEPNVRVLAARIRRYLERSGDQPMTPAYKQAAE